VLDLHFDVTLGSFRAAVELSSGPGETTVILGESGSGKTTVLRVLAGLLSPQEGSFVLDDVVYLNTANGVEVPAQDRPIGYVFQDYAQALTQAHLVGYDDRRPRELSGGQQQRVAIARALALRPRLLLLDESLSALDIQTRRQVVRELRQILSELQLTTVMVSHQYSDALNLAQHIMVLEGGTVIQEGTHLDLLRHPKSSYIAEMTGVNRFEGTVLRYDSDSGTCRIRLSGVDDLDLEIDGIDGDPSHHDQRLSVGDTATVVIHPRNIALSPGGLSAPSNNVIPCFVSLVTPVSASLSAVSDQVEGLFTVVTLIDSRLPTLTADITLESLSQDWLSEGEPGRASVDPQNVLVFANQPAREDTPLKSELSVRG
jgi:molybdate transport system ATP-binding protein